MGRTAQYGAFKVFMGAGEAAYAIKHPEEYARECAEKEKERAEIRREIKFFENTHKKIV